MQNYFLVIANWFFNGILLGSFSWRMNMNCLHFYINVTEKFCISPHTKFESRINWRESLLEFLEILSKMVFSDTTKF